jgi:hypothetical protein
MPDSGVDLNNDKKEWGERFGMTHFVNPTEISTRSFQLVTGRAWMGTAFGGARGRTDGMPAPPADQSWTWNIHEVRDDVAIDAVLRRATGAGLVTSPCRHSGQRRGRLHDRNSRARWTPPGGQRGFGRSVGRASWRP